MKKIVFCAAVLVLAAGYCFAADPVEGFWVSFDEKSGKATAGWEIYTNGGKLYGKILSLAGHPQDIKADKCKDSYEGFPAAGKVSTMTIVGTPWIFDLSMEKTGVWSGGQIIDPDNGKIYKCKITFRQKDDKKYKADVLEMRGEIGLGIGRSQLWQKSDKEKASALR